MKESTLHIMIIWNKALPYSQTIIEELNEEFKVYQIISVNWDKDKYFENLSIFYSHSLKDKSDSEQRKILKWKINDIGKGKFTAIIFEDKTPNFVHRNTTSGNRKVNSNVFDKKMKFRKLVGGGSRIHCSDDAWETNKDLTILFGLNSDDFCKKYGQSINQVSDFDSDCKGVNGYKSIEEFFYVLNNTLVYCVLRNHECLPDRYTVEGHGDIDLLVNDKIYATRLTNARPLAKQKYRVCYEISVNGEKYPFDFRYIGDNYYDKEWEINILNTRKLVRGTFYAPNDENQFYSLLYHAYLQKKEVKSDYHPKLEHYSKLINVLYERNIQKVLFLLHYFLSKFNYSVTIPIDKSVYINKNLRKTLNGWNTVKSLADLDEVAPYMIESNSDSGYVYFKGTKNQKEVFVKYGGKGDSCKNECNMSKRAYKMSPEHFLKVIYSNLNSLDEFLVFEFIKGTPLKDYIKNLDDEEKKGISEQLEAIYYTLCSVGIIHRDIRPDNFLVTEDNVVKLIDFQYAIDANSPEELSCVKNNKDIVLRIGEVYRYKKYAWKDSYSFVKTANELGLQLNFSGGIIDKEYKMPLNLILRCKLLNFEVIILSYLRKMKTNLRKSPLGWSRQ